MAIFYKQGCVGNLIPIVKKTLGKISAYQWTKYKEDTLVTSKQDGYHSDGSLHSEGYAFDFRPGSLTILEIKELAGPGFDVVESNDGAIHVEYDPK